MLAQSVCVSVIARAVHENLGRSEPLHVLSLLILQTQHDQRPDRSKDQSPFDQPKEESKDAHHNPDESTPTTATAIVATSDIGRVTFGIASKGPTGFVWFDAELFGEMLLLLFPQLLRCTVAVDNVGGGDRDNVVIVTYVSCEGGESEVRVDGEGDVVEFETAFPVIPFGVVNLKLGVYSFDVDEFALGCNFGIAIVDGATSNLLPCSVFVILVRLDTVAVHDRDAGEAVRMPRVGVGVEKQTQAGEIVDRAKHGTRLCTILGQPNCHSISGNVGGTTVDLELKDDLKVFGGQGKTRP